MLDLTVVVRAHLDHLLANLVDVLLKLLSRVELRVPKVDLLEEPFLEGLPGQFMSV